jgi:predicted nucleic acid-binding protein
MSSLVLDAGALIAVERHDRTVWALLAEARERGTTTIVPSTVLAQAWRGGPGAAPIALLLEASLVDPLDEGRAKEIGGRLAASGTSDVADAHVACCATERGAAVATSDAGDIAALSPANDPLTLIRL